MDLCNALQNQVQKSIRIMNKMIHAYFENIEQIQFCIFIDKVNVKQLYQDCNRHIFQS